MRILTPAVYVFALCPRYTEEMTPHTQVLPFAMALSLVKYEVGGLCLIGLLCRLLTMLGQNSSTHESELVDLKR